jgi:hypothetical protein
MLKVNKMVIGYLFIGVGVGWLLDLIISDGGTRRGMDGWSKFAVIVLWPVSLLGFFIILIKSLFNYE